MLYAVVASKKSSKLAVRNGVSIPSSLYGSVTYRGKMKEDSICVFNSQQLIGIPNKFWTHFSQFIFSVHQFINLVYNANVALFSITHSDLGHN